jgi:hypothetical protein
MVHLAVWDHESGNQDKIRDDINKVLQDGASKAASALMLEALSHFNCLHWAHPISWPVRSRMILLANMSTLFRREI